MDNSFKISLCGQWELDYISSTPYEKEDVPKINSGCTVSLPCYFEDITDIFKKAGIYEKMTINPLYDPISYPFSGDCPDMYLADPVGTFAMRRSFEIKKDFLIGEVSFWCGGAQNTLSLWINGVFVGKHKGYSSDFELYIPKDLFHIGENEIVITVSNNRLGGYKELPVSGLTSRAANECTGGVYGDIELRSAEDKLRDLWVRSDRDLKAFTVFIDPFSKETARLEIFDGEQKIFEGEFTGNALTVSSDGFELWSVNNPKLYIARVTVMGKIITRKFGIRSLTADGTHLLLNKKPFFFRGICEHCYYPITVHPPRDKDYYKRVILSAKALGFNSIRFHTHIPMTEYMEAADECGMLLELETPNNTSFEEWREIVHMARRYTSALIYSSGNEMVIDEDYIEHLRACADIVHSNSDALISPMSAMRGIEYHSYGDCRVETPFPHNPKRLSALSEFCDLYNSYSLGQTSYGCDKGSCDVLEKRNSIYKKPILTHEICISGTYCDLSLEERYSGSRIRETTVYSSVREHLTDKGLIEKAHIYYKNSVLWQSLIRKNCFELVRRCESFAGYDFLGDIDTHWHTYGYCVGMSNEFYELKDGETQENVLRYNSDAVLLCDLPRRRSFYEGEETSIPILISNYGEDITDARLEVTVSSEETVYLQSESVFSDIPSGKISELINIPFTFPSIKRPRAMKIKASISGRPISNEWDIYVFPKEKKRGFENNNLHIVTNVTKEELLSLLDNGENLLLFSGEPFAVEPTKFQISLAGRTTGHLATIIKDHPVFRDFPHKGFADLAMREMLTEANAVILDTATDFDPIFEIATTYKDARKEAMLFEYRALSGKLLVCSLNLRESDPGAVFLKNRIIEYASGNDFSPKHEISREELASLLSLRSVAERKNQNAAMNKNDITMK